MKILLIEDDKVDQMAFQRFVEEQNLSYAYTIAGSAAEAMKVLTSDKFDIVITDYSLGDGTAFDILPFLKDSPFIITTGTGDERSAVKMLKSGAQDYLIKDPERRYLQVLPITVNNVFRHRKTEERNNMLSSAVMGTKDSIYITDKEGRIFFVNKAFCDQYQHIEEDILGKTIDVLREEKSPEKNEVFHKRKDGSIFPVSLTRSAIKDNNGNEIATIVVARDISERVQLEQELARSNADLETFASTVSHDLQEPLRKIMMFGELLEQHLGSVLDPTGKDYLQRMRDAASRMSNLIQDLLSLSKVAQDMAPFRSVDLNAVISQVIRELEIMIAESGAQIKTEPLPPAQGQPTQIRQLFQNLIGNAVKFRHKDRPPYVTVYSCSPKNGFVDISVTDNGIGFEDKFTEEIFQPFRRLNPKGKYKGSGLGLAICKKIALRHGGSISAKSVPGEGSTFTVTLPVP